MNDGKVISFRCHTYSNVLPSEPKGLGSILATSPIFLLCFIKCRYDREEFNTDCSKGFLKSLNEIL